MKVVIIDILAISCFNKNDVNCLIQRMTNLIQKQMEQNTYEEERGFITRERQRNCLEQCIKSLSNWFLLQEEDLVDLQAEELRTCLKSLARLTGDVDVEEILDIVFSDFCIGK